MGYIYLSIAIMLEVIATTLLKYSNGFTVLLPTIGSLALYGVSFYCLSVCMQTLPTGIVYAIWSGIGIVMISILSFFIHKQSLDVPAICGMALIIIGVLVIKLFSKSVS